MVRRPVNFKKYIKKVYNKYLNVFVKMVLQEVIVRFLDVPKNVKPTVTQYVEMVFVIVVQVWVVIIVLEHCVNVTVPDMVYVATKVPVIAKTVGKVNIVN